MKSATVINLKDLFSNTSFTLVEVIIFLFFISLIFLSILTQVNSSLRTNINLKNKTYALYFGEQLKEWLSGEREEDWNNLYSRRDAVYCFNSTDLLWPESGSCPEDDYSLNNFFKRELRIIGISSERINYKIKVYWKEATSIQFIEINGAFSKFEF